MKATSSPRPRRPHALPCAVPGWPTLASRRAELTAATLRARNHHHRHAHEPAKGGK